jgi:hypothetical protein
MVDLVPKFQEINLISESDINKVKEDTKETVVIPYRDWAKKQTAVPIYKVPIEYCKYRVNNGRIITQVQTYIRNKAPLDPNSEHTQQIISSFLGETDQTQNENLKKILKVEGQKEPVVITADGFLINGNRRKWAFENLNKKEPNEAYRYLKVVILPGTNNPLRPTIADIALLENRYQVYLTGKSDYTIMNKVLTLYTNEKMGIPLEEMLKDDPVYAGLETKAFTKAVEKFRKENFSPLELMQQYLVENKTPDDYVRVADKWSSFYEYSKNIKSKLEDYITRENYEIREQDIGLIQAAAFNIIKLKDYSEIESRNHEIIRKFFKFIEVDKNELYKIGRIEDVDANITNAEDRYKKWNDENKEKIVRSLKKLKGLTERKEDQEGPIKRLEEIISKLDHEDLDYEKLTYMKKADVPEALRIANSAQTRINNIVKLLFHIKTGKEFDLAELLKEFNKK